MSFVIDGSEWAFDGWSADDIDQALGHLSERVDVARSRGENVWIGDDLQSRSVLGPLDVWSLWSEESPLHLPVELGRELAAMLRPLGGYLDEEPWPDGMEFTRVAIGDDLPVENEDVAWAHHHVRGDRAVACLGLRRRGVFKTTTDAGSAQVHWVVDEAEHRAFYRAAIDVERDSEQTLERLSSHAFPDLCFVAGIWRELSAFAGGYTRVRKDLRRILAVLDDVGKWAFTEPPPKLQPTDELPRESGEPGRLLIQQRFQAVGLDVAPEKASVARTSRFSAPRERVVDGRTLYCEWHVKIAPHINRVHIHPPVPESDERLVVAIFHAHLPLPGDT